MRKILEGKTRYFKNELTPKETYELKGKLKKYKRRYGMVSGIDKFKDFFADYKEQYVIVGVTNEQIVERLRDIYL